MARKYTETKRIENSYSVYRRDWAAWKIKGYAMKSEAPMSFEEYKKAFKLAKLANVKNIARNFAADGRVLSHYEAVSIFKDIEAHKDQLKELNNKFKSIKQLKKEINSWQYSQYAGLQALFMNLKDQLGEETADEIFGY